MNELITVAVPTRHRHAKLARFVESFLDTTPEAQRPRLLVISDAPDYNDPTIPYMDELRNKFHYPLVEYNINPEKSGLAQLWNQCIIRSSTDWVLVCNDDGVFQAGWLEWLEKQINDKYLQVNLMHYGGFCIHKKMLLLNGWFDEHFFGGGFEDNDWQLRLSESELNELVYDWTCNWTYMHHNKVNDNNNWTDQNNRDWMRMKWGRQDLHAWSRPSYRRMPEIDWHPLHTKKYEVKYNISSRIAEINTLVNSGRPIYHRGFEPR